MSRSSTRESATRRAEPPARIADPWGERTPYGPSDDWPQRVDLALEDGLTEDDVDAWVPTASVLHSNGDGLDIAVRQGEERARQD